MNVVRKYSVLWGTALRAPFFSASAMSVVVGSAAAWHYGAPRDYPAFVLALVGVVALHAGANLANDYYDHLSGNDARNPYFNPFSGGSRLIQDGLLAPRAYLVGSAASFAVALSCAAWLMVTRGGWQIPVLGIAGLLLGFLYTAPPMRFVYRGAGELAIFASFGPLATMGAYFVQAGRVDAAGFWCGVPVGLLVALILLVNEFPDFEADKGARKFTLIVLLERVRGLYLVAAAYAAAYALVALFVAVGVAPRGALWTFATLPAPVFLLWWLARNRYLPPRLQPSSAAGILTHLAFSATLAAAYMLA